MKFNEHLNQVALFSWAALYVSQYPALKNIFSIPNGGHRHISVAKKLKAEGVRAGVPDIFLAQPNSEYAGLFIEMKSEKGTISDAQAEWLERLETARYRCEVCYSWTAAANIIIDYLNLPIEKVR